MAILVRFCVVFFVMCVMAGQANAISNTKSTQFRYITAKEINNQFYFAETRKRTNRFHVSASVKKKPSTIAAVSKERNKDSKVKAAAAVQKNKLRRKAVAAKKKEFRQVKKKINRLRVTATAYNSLPSQTDSTPNIAAWGDRLRPGMKAIAVSRDLLKKYGLKHKDKVRISGLKGEYLVLDKMNKRWRKKIDIYMGKDRRKALRWGRKKVTIRW